LNAAGRVEQEAMMKTKPYLAGRQVEEPVAIQHLASRCILRAAKVAASVSKGLPHTLGFTNVEDHMVRTVLNWPQQRSVAGLRHA
jgi:hypothetical protein